MIRSRRSKSLYRGTFAEQFERRLLLATLAYVKSESNTSFDWKQTQYTTYLPWFPESYFPPRFFEDENLDGPITGSSDSLDGVWGNGNSQFFHVRARATPNYFDNQWPYTSLAETSIEIPNFAYDTYGGIISRTEATSSAYAERKTTVRIEPSTQWETWGDPVYVGVAVSKVGTASGTTSIGGEGNHWARIGDEITLSTKATSQLSGAGYNEVVYPEPPTDGFYESSVAIVSLSFPPPPDPDIFSESLDWRTIANGGGVDLVYSIKNRDLVQSAAVSFYWADSPTATNGQLAATAETDTVQGVHKIELRATSISPPPNFDSYLVAVIDSSNEISESSEANNQSGTKGLFIADVELDVESLGSSLFTSLIEAAKNEPYTVSVIVTNQSPVAIPAFDLWWTEIRSIGIKPLIPPVDTLGTGDVSIPAIRFGSQQTVTLGTFTHNWEWIDAENPYLDNLIDALTDVPSFLTEIAEFIRINVKRINLFSTIEGLVATAVDFYKNTEPANKFRYQLGTSQKILLTGDFAADVTVGVPVIRFAAFGTYLLVSGQAAATITTFLKEVSIALALGSLPLALTAAPTFALGAVQLLAASGYYELAKDPPDPDYTAIVVLEPMSPPSSGLVGIKREMLKAQFEIASLRNAELRARNKADGAEVAGDQVWQSRQLLAAAEFARRAAVLQSNAIALDSLMAGASGSASNDELAAAIEYIRVNGLPEMAKSIFVQAGWTTMQIQALTDAILQTTSLPNISIDDRLAQARASAALEAFAAADQQMQGIRIRIGKLSLSIGEVSQSQKDAFTVKQAEIELLLSNGLPSVRLSGMITQYISDVSGLLNTTNNLAALQDNLDFSYSALVRYQELDVRPAALTEFVEAQRVAGFVTEEATNSLNSFANAMESTLSQADYAAYAAVLVDFEVEIDRLRSGEITAEIADALNEYAEYLGELSHGKPPTHIALTNSSLAENAGVNAVIGMLSAIDPEASDTFTFSLPAGVSDNAAFNISGTSLRANASFDFETKSSYSVTVRVTDAGGLTFDKVFTISVTNATELGGIDVQNGETQRSYLRKLDAVFDHSSGLMDLINNNRLQLTRFDLNGLNGSLMVLPARTVVGNKIRFDFGELGIGGNRNTNVGDGYYELGIDMDGNGSFESKKYFHRLLGDVTGDGRVDASDKSLVLSASGTPSVESDVNGDGLVNILDTSLLSRAVGRKLKGDLFRDD